MFRQAEMPCEQAVQRRDWSILIAIAVLAVACVLFFWRQNSGGSIGGEMSLPKLLWLNYALIAWFIVPFGFWRSPRLAPALRRIHGSHLTLFLARGIAELWLLYVMHAWIPPYGIAHDLVTIAWITLLLVRARNGLKGPLASSDRAALRFLTSIRLGLVCEMVFAWLFYKAVHHETSRLWFAGNEARFLFINGLTWAVVLPAYLDLGRVLLTGSEVLFPAAPSRRTEVNHG